MSRASEIVASIDLTTGAGHNLRCVLLLLLAGKDWQDADVGGTADVDASIAAEKLGLIAVSGAAPWFELTTLGRDVAELLRPKPWTTEPDDDDTRLLDPCDNWIATFDHRDASRETVNLIARLLTEHYERQATSYVGGAGS